MKKKIKPYKSGAELRRAINSNTVDVDKVWATLKNPKSMENSKIEENIYDLPFSMLSDMVDFLESARMEVKAYNLCRDASRFDEIDPDLLKIVKYCLDTTRYPTRVCNMVGDNPYFEALKDKISSVLEENGVELTEVLTSDKAFARKHLYTPYLTQDIINEIEIPYDEVLKKSRGADPYYGCGIRFEDIDIILGGKNARQWLARWFSKGKGWAKVDPKGKHYKKFLEFISEDPEYYVERDSNLMNDKEVLQDVADSVRYNPTRLNLCFDNIELFKDDREKILSVIEDFINNNVCLNRPLGSIYDVILPVLTNQDIIDNSDFFLDNTICEIAVERNAPDILQALSRSIPEDTLKKVSRLPLRFRRHYIENYLDDLIGSNPLPEVYDKALELVGRSEVITAVPVFRSADLNKEVSELKEKLVLSYNTSTTMVFDTIELDGNNNPIERELCYSCMGYHQREKGTIFISVNHKSDGVCNECGSVKLNVSTNGELPKVEFPKAG